MWLVREDNEKNFAQQIRNKVFLSLIAVRFNEKEEVNQDRMGHCRKWSQGANV